jgi:hypothetical protein
MVVFHHVLARVETRRVRLRAADLNYVHITRFLRFDSVCPALHYCTYIWCSGYDQRRISIDLRDT